MNRPQRPVIFFFTLGAILMLLASCKTGALSYDRHNMSRLYEASGKGLIYFDTAVSAQYPLDSAEAESVRMEWISEWLEIRNLCQNGFDIKDRRLLNKEDDNPYLHDLRYEILCN